MVDPLRPLQVYVTTERKKVEHFHLRDFITTRNFSFTECLDLKLERVSVLRGKKTVFVTRRLTVNEAVDCVGSSPVFAR